MAIYRIPRILAETGDSRSKYYADAAMGLAPKPIKIGARAVGVPSHEIDALNRARTAGKSPDEIRSLVQQLEADRQQVAA